MNVIEPPLDRTFIDDCYACRQGKGVHAAVDRYQHWARSRVYALKMDVQQYFPSIDHTLLKRKLARRIKDGSVLELLERIIDGSPQAARMASDFSGDDPPAPLECRCGIPIGNLTSQFFANLYLDDLEHHLKEVLKVKAYLRYVDDMVVLDNDKGRLLELRDVVRQRLALERLRLHPRKAHVSRVRRGLDWLGYTVFPDRRRLRNDNGLRFRRKLRVYARAYAEGRLSWQEIHPRVQSWIAHAKHADTAGLRWR